MQNPNETNRFDRDGIKNYEPAEKALRETEEKYRSLFENIGDAVFVADAESGLIVDANRQAQKLTGYSLADLKRMHQWQLHPPELKKLMQAVFFQSVESAPGTIKEHLLRHSAGYDIPVEISSGGRFRLGDRWLHIGVFRDSTGRKRAEEALRASEEKFRVLVEQAQEGIWSIDADAITTYVNPRMAEILGYSVDEMMGRHLFSFMGKEKRDRAGENLGRRRRGIAETHEFEFLHKNGTRVLTSLSAAPVMDAGGAFQGATAVVTDITERKRVEEALRESEERFCSAFEYAPIGKALVSPEGRWLKVNRATCELLGYSEHELLAKTFQDLTHPDDLAADLAFVQRMLEGSIRTYQMEKRYFHKEGHVIWALLSVSLVRDQQGVPLYFISQIVDITERKRAEEALQRQLRFEQGVASASVCLLKPRDAGQNITEALARLRDAADVARVYIFENFDDPTDGLCTRQSYEVCAPGVPPEIDNPVLRHVVYSNGFDRWRKTLSTGGAVWGNVADFPWEERAILEPQGIASIVVVPFSPGGAWRGFIGFDETRFHRAWQEGEVTLLRTAADLIGGYMARIRAEEDREKLQTQLTQAQKMESVGRLAGGVAHDFNNMLCVIQGYTEMALNTVDASDPLHASLTVILNAAARSADLARQLLAFARKQTVTPKLLDLNVKIESTLRMLRRLIGEDIELAWIPGSSVWTIMMDPSQIDQILANLCVNARDAIAGIGRITIETRNVTCDEVFCAGHADFMPGDFVMLTMSDNGCGMNKEILDKLFEPFFTTKELGKGTGLGLATVYGIVKQNNGFITVRSETGEGTVFEIYLPRHGDEAAPLPESDGEIPPARGLETILLVEDEPAILEITTAMLEHLGYTVLTTAAPDRALRLAGEYTGEIHLVMTDVVMPQMNGRDLAKKLVSLRPDLKCLYMSGYTADFIAHHGVLDGGVHFIQKPFSRNDLAAKIREVLDGGKMGRECQ